MGSSVQLAQLNASHGRGKYQSYFSRFLRDDAGLIAGVSDYTGHAFAYFRGPPAGQIWHVNRMIGHVEDAGGFDGARYGNNIVLTTGISFGIMIGTVSSGATITRDCLDGQPILTNADWGHFAYDIRNVTFGVGNEFLQFRWTFEKGGAPFVLNGDLNESIAIIYQNDDFTNLIDQTYVIQGISFVE